MRSITFTFCLVVGMHFASADVLIHDYILNGAGASYADTLGGPSLTPDGGTLSSSGYTFGMNQGLTLPSSAVPASYTIQVTFEFTKVTGYNKIMDFTNLQGYAGTDPGMYVHNGTWNYFDSGEYLGTISPGTFYTLDLSRNDATKNVSVSVAGQGTLYNFTDNGGNTIAYFTPGTTKLWFFEDDYRSSRVEASPGVVTNIEIFTPNTVPEPSMFAALGLMLPAIVYGARHRKRRPEA